MSDKIFLKGVSAKEVETKYGTLLKISFNAKTFTDELIGYANEKGYVNCKVGKRKEADKYGNTHYLELDTWKPQQETVVENTPQRVIKEAVNDPKVDDELPF